MIFFLSVQIYKIIDYIFSLRVKLMTFLNDGASVCKMPKSSVYKFSQRGKKVSTNTNIELFSLLSTIPVIKTIIY